MSGVTVDVSQLMLDKFGDPSRLKAIQLNLTNKVKQDSEKFVPMDTGQLRGNVIVTAEEFEYEEEYAAPVYNSKGKNWTTPGTTDHWMDESEAVNMPEWERFVKQRILGGS